MKNPHLLAGWRVQVLCPPEAPKVCLFPRTFLQIPSIRQIHRCHCLPLDRITRYTCFASCRPPSIRPGAGRLSPPENEHDPHSADIAQQGTFFLQIPPFVPSLNPSLYPRPLLDRFFPTSLLQRRIYAATDSCQSCSMSVSLLLPRRVISGVRNVTQV